MSKMPIESSFVSSGEVGTMPEPCPLKSKVVDDILNGKYVRESHPDPKTPKKEGTKASRMEKLYNSQIEGKPKPKGKSQKPSKSHWSYKS